MTQREMFKKFSDYWDDLLWIERENLVDHPWGDYPFEVQPLFNQRRIITSYHSSEGKQSSSLKETK